MSAAPPPRGKLGAAAVDECYDPTAATFFVVFFFVHLAHSYSKLADHEEWVSSSAVRSLVRPIISTTFFGGGGCYLPSIFFRALYATKILWCVVVHSYIFSSYVALAARGERLRLKGILL